MIRWFGSVNYYPTDKIWSLASLPREAGISPLRRLISKSKFVKLERFPNCSGIPPVILLPGNDLHKLYIK